MVKSLLIDIGNSSTIAASYESGMITLLPPIETKDLSSGEHALSMGRYDKIIVSSVVPEANDIFASYSNVTFIDYKNIPVIKVNIDRPSQLGADRLVNALAAYSMTKSSCLVIDSGTATTLCYIDKNGRYEGGIILAGMRIASQALTDYTAKIPLIWVKKTDALFGKTTEQAVQIGLFKGAINSINGFIREFKKFDPTVKVIGTGTGLALIKDEITLDDYVPDLIFKGLAICAD